MAAQRVQPFQGPFRKRAFALTANKRTIKVEEEGEATNKNVKQPVAADGYLICHWRESAAYDPSTGELNFRARKSSSTSIGSNRRSCEIGIAEDSHAQGSDAMADSSLKEDAPPAEKILTIKKKTSGCERVVEVEVPIKADSCHNVEVDDNKARKSSDSSIEEVDCVSAKDCSVWVQNPFHKNIKDLVMELPSYVKLSRSCEKNIAHEELDSKRSPAYYSFVNESDGFRTPEEVKQAICSSLILPSNLPLLPPPNDLNKVASNPPCICTIQIKNVSCLLKPKAHWSSATDPICIPTSAKSEECYKMKILFQVSLGYFSVSIIIIKGKYDHVLSWPFPNTILFSLRNADERWNHERGFKCYGNGLNFIESLGRPKLAENVPIGILCFLPVKGLENGFILDNSVVLNCFILPRDLGLSAQVNQLSQRLFLTQKCFINSFSIDAM